MEPNKFEQDIRQKMEQRTIQPTEMAWDRLDAMLSITEEKKKKPGRTWMYMAASFLALLLVGTLFLNREKENGTTNTTTNSVVTTVKQPEVIDEEVSPTKVIAQPLKKQDAVATVTNAPAKATIKSTKVTVKHYATLNNATVANTTAPAAALNESVAVTNSQSVVITPKVTPSKIKVDANSLLASVDRTSAVKPAMSNPVVINPAVKQASVKVNANSLLSSVEGELDDSFRTKVLNTVSKNFDKVKTSVATRNRQ